MHNRILRSGQIFALGFNFFYRTNRPSSFESHLADLFRYQAHHKNDNGGHKHKDTHVRESTAGYIRIEIIGYAQKKHREADGKKYPHW